MSIFPIIKLTTVETDLKVYLDFPGVKLYYTTRAEIWVSTVHPYLRGRLTISIFIAGIAPSLGGSPHW